MTSKSIFQTFALAAEFFVFLYMGMGICVGQFGRWELSFMILAIIFCFLARLFNIFPLSFIANCGYAFMSYIYIYNHPLSVIMHIYILLHIATRRSTKIPLQMQIVQWFAGLRGMYISCLNIYIYTFRNVSSFYIISTIFDDASFINQFALSILGAISFALSQ